MYRLFFSHVENIEFILGPHRFYYFPSKMRWHQLWQTALLPLFCIAYNNNNNNVFNLYSAHFGKSLQRIIVWYKCFSTFQFIFFVLTSKYLVVKFFAQVPFR